MWRVLVVILLLAIVAGINYLVIDSLWWWGIFQTTYNHGSGTCQKLNRTERGSGEIHLIPDSGGIALITSSIKENINNDSDGRILVFEMEKPELEPKELPIQADSDFKFSKPYGMSTWTGATGAFLYVISRNPQQVVDKFLIHRATDLSKWKLIHHRRIENESSFVSLKDLAVIGNDQFYFTNDIRYHYVELVFRASFGSVGYYNGSHAELLEENLFMPNGLAVSNDTRFLYVGLTGGKEIRIYSIAPDTKKLSFNNSIQASTSVNDLFLHPNGDLWFAAIPVLYKVRKYMENPAENKAPSQIMRVTMSSSWKADKIEEIYSNDGTEISASSSVVVYGSNNAMLISSLVSDTYFCGP